MPFIIFMSSGRSKFDPVLLILNTHVRVHETVLYILLGCGVANMQSCTRCVDQNSGVVLY
uniref:Uncharacterized protein n=1 Tax=Setaria italica TaxID=4555 RepID=K3Y0S4_SETIT